MLSTKPDSLRGIQKNQVEKRNKDYSCLLTSVDKYTH